MRKLLQHRGTKGFTLIELMVSLMVLSLISLFSSNIYLNYTSSSRDIKAGNMVYEEARFLMERLVREVRQNTVDYEEYFNQNVMIPVNGDGSYGDNYCSYSAFFYDNNGESIGTRNGDKDFDYTAAVVTAGLGTDARAVHPVEDELYLINIPGNRKTILTRVEKDDGGETIGRVAMLRMIGKDFGNDGINGQDSYNNGTNGSCIIDDRENDGLIDTWRCDPDYPCKTDVPVFSDVPVLGCEGLTHLATNDPLDVDNHSFIDISPNALNVLDLKFLITPEDDPWKAYNMNDIQIQPHVTIQLTVEANRRLIDTTFEDHIPSITLTSTVTTRNYSEIKSECQK